MKVYNLACPLDHRFEGWFASEEDCLAQQDKDMLACPVCDSTNITRMPSAPRIAKLTSTALTSPNEDIGKTTGEVVALAGNEHSNLKGMHELMGKSEDVGSSFAEEARKIHYKEAPERSIRGQTTLDEAESLRDEGIEVLAIPMMPAFKNTLQ